MREAGAAGLHEHGLVDGVVGHVRQEILDGGFALGGHTRGDLARKLGAGTGEDVQMRVNTHSFIGLG